MEPAGVVEEADSGFLAVVDTAAGGTAVASQKACAVAVAREIAGAVAVVEAGRLVVAEDTGPAGRAEWPSPG